MPQDLTHWGFLASSAPAGVPGSGVVISATPNEAEYPPPRFVKILGISCSPHTGKNTAAVTSLCLDAVRAVAGRIEVELVELGAWNLSGEVAAGIAQDAGQRDIFPGLAAKLSAPSVAGIVLATPIYYGDMSFLSGAFLDWCAVFHQGKLLANKLGGVLAMGSAKNGEVERTLRWMQAVLISQQMNVVGCAAVTGHRDGAFWAGKPAAGTGPAPSMVFAIKGITAVKNLGRRVAEMALRPAANRPREVLRLR